MSISIEELTHFVNDNITAFHDNRIDSLNNLNLRSILKRKNPYLFKAKNLTTAQDMVKNLLDSYLSSKEETIFGDLLEKLAIFCCSQIYGGYKSGIEGIDLEFGKDSIRYIVSIKSGPNWGNSSQIQKMKDNFKKAQKILRTTKSNIHIIAVNGCCYGKDNNPDKGDYFKYCGQEFWTFITGEDDFYLKIVEPLGYNAKIKNDDFYEKYSKMLNKLTKSFIDEYCDKDGGIYWDKIVIFNSGKK